MTGKGLPLADPAYIAALKVVKRDWEAMTPEEKDLYEAEAAALSAVVEECSAQETPGPAVHARMSSLPSATATKYEAAEGSGVRA